MFKKQAVLCVGDIMIDEFVRGSVSRISPEAPVPVFCPETTNVSLGGAGNVARNLCDLGADVFLCSVAAHDADLFDLITKSGIHPLIIENPEKSVPKKVRYISSGTHLLRVDTERIEFLSSEYEDRLISVIESVIDKTDIVILSDYRKGVLTDRVISSVISIANGASKYVFVDPKGKDFSRYNGADIITPNLNELLTASKDGENGDIESIATNLVASLDLSMGMLLKRGKDGMSFIKKGASPIAVRAKKQEVFDVSGAGDTVIATLALAIASGMDMKNAMILANRAAGIVISKGGTASVSSGELFGTEVKTEDQTIQEWRDAGHSIGFTNGCFDLLHDGHILTLKTAKSLCDRLIVGINSDDSIRKLKGDGRPIQNASVRKAVLEALQFVDLVIEFSDPTPIALIEKICPNFLIKGGDYAGTEVVGASFVESYGGSIVFANFVNGASTTSTVDKIRKM